MDQQELSPPSIDPALVESPWKPVFPRVTCIIVATTVAIFLVQLYYQHRFGDDVVGNALAFSPHAWAQGRYWTALSYAWAHAVAMFDHPGLFWLHIVANMIPLICLGPALEDFLGHLRFLGLYVGGAIAAALVWFIFNRHAPQGIIGASGAVFALIAAAGTAAPRERVMVFIFFFLPVNMSLRVLAITVCLGEVAQIVFGWLPDVAHSAHLGGAAFGVAYILLMRATMREYPELL